MYHSIGNIVIHVPHIFNSHIAKLSILLSRNQIFEFAFSDIEIFFYLIEYVQVTKILSKKEFASYFES